MSAKTLSTALDDVDKQREELIVQLPWYKRIPRRYLTGDSFWSYQLSSALTWPQGIGVGFALSKLWTGWLVTHPIATANAIKLWGWTTSAAAAIWAVVTP